MKPASIPLTWFAAHELKLAWRDWAQLLSGGRKLKDNSVLFGMAVVALVLHAIAYAALSPHMPLTTENETALLILLSMSVALAFTMMFSQAMEHVTRAFYARDDLDLILSSPAPSRHLFAVRITATALTTAIMSGLLVAPFINVAAWLNGASWLAGYVVMGSVAALATGCAVLATLALFRHVGAKRTRLVAQIIAAVVGASFLIGIQAIAIVSYGTMSRFALLNSADVVAQMPDSGSPAWLPARAVMGEPLALTGFALVALTFFVVIVHAGALRFPEHVVSALGVGEGLGARARRRRTYTPRSLLGALIVKEWMLLRRDPWLVSQTLMQILYLIPPALMLWSTFGSKVDVVTLLTPVLAMASGQLAGALAWLAISGEDAPDLVHTAPVSARTLIAAKVISVLAITAAVILPFIIALLFVSIRGAGVALAGVTVSAAIAVLIQIWFRAQMRRSLFRRRQVASRLSTLLEAMASILIAATAGAVAAGSWLALAPALLTGLILIVAFKLRPRTS